MDKIYKIVNIPEAQRAYIITNFDALLKFTDNIVIVLSALLHYIDQTADYFKQKEI